MYILGLTTLGDAAATIIRDGELIAAVEEERFSRIKHHSGFPFQSIQYCLREAGISLADVEHVALYWKPWVLWHKAMQALKSAAISRDMFKARVDRGIKQVSESYLGMFTYPRRLRKRFGPSHFRFHYLEHHLCHAASAFFVSPFEKAAILTMDGTGEDTTTLFSIGKGLEIKPLKRIKLPHSLGQFYSAVTNFLGFDMFAGDEWKVMGLAAYGEPEYYDFFSKRVLSLNGHHDFQVNIRVLDHHLAKHYQFSEEIVRELGPPRRPGEEITERHQNIAASAQRILEDTVLRLLQWLYEKTREENLCLAGGVAFNSVMNGRIINESPFKRVFIQPAAGDAGCSLGAAYYVYHQLLRRPRSFVMEHAYYGPSFSNEECAEALRNAGIEFEILPDEELLPRVARMIAEGAVVGWFQGRMEFGPRALGNRSFLADPRRADMRELLNKKVKLREWFRPLAPSMLEEISHKIFGKAHYDPFMITVLSVTEEYRSRIPAVVHIDGTARPQTVRRHINPRYWRLINEFGKITGVPVLLNTSFNIQEPIVCRPEDAIRTFQSANFDALVLENNLVLRYKE
ncbi:carbamoyltransferase family protein [Pyrinomonas methylaliphatogenes]|uniref:Predicted carbamoyl transferase, NodU family n=1 Tax=Pyrinomonas methylaliphatogenes TaxID=454194 RepID=A0A0B6WXV0_9BACT|nr:carbamoyltransferase [Pyrinomonas methylaliphatogenes]CDM65094.1 predicted carbamoyl transferase, NodU family [Pyrinomonas methylaliphatogenes]